MAWIEKRPKGYLVRWREPSGKVASARRRTSQEARQLKAEMESQILRGSYVEKETRQLPFGEYAKLVLDSDRRLADATRENYERNLRLHLAPLAQVPIEHVDATKVRALFGRMAEAGATPSVLDGTHKTLSKICAVAMEDGILTRNPAKAVRVPKPEPRKVRPLTPQQVSAVADAVPGRWRMTVLLAAWGGLRIGEVGGLHRDDIDWDRGAVHVQRSASHTGLKETKTKSSNRVVTLPAWVMTELKKHVLEYASPEGWLFLTQYGNHITHHTIAPIMRKATNEEVDFHDLRHTQAALLIKQGVHPRAIMERMGHSSITQTMNTYGHLFEGAHDELARTLEQFDPGEIGKVVEL